MKQFIEKYCEEKGEKQIFKINIRFDIPTQHNGVDCGVFLCTYAERISRKAGFNFYQSNMSLFRWKMTWEILNGSVKEFIQVKDDSTAAKTTRKAPTQPGGKKIKTNPKKKAESTEDEAEGRKKNIQWPPANSEEWK